VLIDYALEMKHTATEVIEDRFKVVKMSRSLRALVSLFFATAVLMAEGRRPRSTTH
jgi:Na+/proline symporter